MSRLHFSSIVAAGVLLFAAAMKAADMVSGAVSLNSYSLATVLVTFEIILGLWLLSGIFSRQAGKTAAICFLLFGVWSFKEAMAGNANCGCFGALSVNPWITAIFDIGMACWLYIGRLKAADDQFIRRNAALLACPLFAGVLIVPSWLLLSKPARQLTFVVQKNSVNMLRPADWVGQVLPVKDYVDVWDRVRHGHWKLVFADSTCGACRRKVHQLDQQARAPAKNKFQIAVIEMPPFAKTTDGWIPIDSSLVHGHFSANILWEMTVPATVNLVDGRVVGIGP